MAFRSGEFQQCLCPVSVVGKLGAQGEDDFVHLTVSRQFQLQICVRHSVDAPAVMRVQAMRLTGADSVDDVAGGEKSDIRNDSVPQALRIADIRGNMRLHAGLRFGVIGIESKIPCSVYFFGAGRFCFDQVSLSEEGPRRITCPQDAEGNREPRLSFDVDQSGKHRVLQPDFVKTGLADFDADLISLPVFRRINQMLCVF